MTDHSMLVQVTIDVPRERGQRVRDAICVAGPEHSEGDAAVRVSEEHLKRGCGVCNRKFEVGGTMNDWLSLTLTMVLANLF
jgi:hypothetical protein